MLNHSASADPIGRLARGVFFVLLLATPLVFTGAALEAFETPKNALVQLGALNLAALMIVAAVEQRWRLRRDAVVCAALAFGLSAALSTAFSISPRTSLWGGIESLAGLSTIAAYLAILLAARFFVTDAEQARRLLVAPLLAAGIAAAYAIVQALRLDPYPWGASSAVGGFTRPFSTLGHANNLGGYLVATVPIAVYWMLRVQGWKRVAIAAIAMLSLVAIALTLSRGAWLALAAIACLGAGMLARQGRWRVIGVGFVAAFAVVVVGWFAAGEGFRRGVAERFAHFTDGAGRLPLWRAGLAMAADHPLTGVGLDAYPLAFGQYRPREFWLSEWNTTPTRAHNELVQVLATQGVLGLAAMIALAAAAMFALHRTWKTAHDRAMIVALAATLLAVGVYGLTSFTVAAIGVLTAIVIGLAERAAPIARTIAPRWGVRYTAACVVATCAAVGVVGPFRADVRCRSAECWALVDPAAALPGFEAAAAANPGRDLLWFKLSKAARSAARLTTDVGDRQRLNDRARVAQLSAIDLVPAHPLHRAHYARLLSELCQENACTANDVAKAYESALAGDPRNPSLLAEAGHAAWARGDRASAREYLAAGIELDPTQANLRALSGLVAMAEGHFEEASNQFETAARGDWHGNADGFWQTMNVWAACLLRLNRANEASAIADEVGAERPHWPAPRFTKAYALMVLGRRTEAHALFAEIIEYWPRHPLAAEARKQIKRMKDEG